MSVKKEVNYFAVLIGMAIAWAVLFGITVITKAPTMARGVMPLISVVIVLWLVYWTVAAIRGRFTPVAEQSSAPEQTCQQENVQPKGRVVSKSKSK
jgi:hypothetical protein